jgi:DNA-binding CsgD family transcriptional regulator
MEMETFNTVSTSPPTFPKAENFFGLLTDILIQDVSEAFFQRLLDLTIGEISNAQAGSMMVLQGERYHFVSANGYNLQELQKVTLSLDESILLAEPYRKSFLLHNFEKFNQTNLDLDRCQILQNAGRVPEIKETLLIPIRQQSQTVATLSLDNFDNVKAFTPQEVAMGEHLGVVLGLALKLQVYQQRFPQSEIPRQHHQSSVISDVPLCPRDKDILMYLIEGLSNKKIAAKLDIADNTVRNYLQSLYRKIKVHSRTQAVKWANGHIWK